MSRRTSLGCAALLTALSLGATNASASIAQYQVTFNATWSPATHPGAYPGGAHFSPLIGGTHDAGAAFWQPGGLATQGIEDMAERGSTLALRNEVNTQIAAGHAGSVIAGFGTAAPGATSTTFTIDDAHPLVSLVTMVAPSPDWFVGVHGLSLGSGNGQWRDHLTVDLFAYDAGTDDGATFTSPDVEPMMHHSIARLDTAPFMGAGPLGTFEFTLLSSTGSVVPEPAGAGLFVILGFMLLTRRAARFSGS